MAEESPTSNLCEHSWGYRKPAKATLAVRICSLCHDIDGEDLMREVAEFTARPLYSFRQKPVTLLYAHSDGSTYSYPDRVGGVPDSARERALLRALLGHALAQLDEHETS